LREAEACAHIRLGVIPDEGVAVRRGLETEAEDGIVVGHIARERVV
jgi:hypothetical protein